MPSANDIPMTIVANINIGVAYLCRLIELFIGKLIMTNSDPELILDS